MEAFFLIKIGEILLKLGNRKEFETRLRNQLKKKLAGIDHTIESYPGRYFLIVHERDAPLAEQVLAHTPGINGYARALKCRKKPEAILAAAEKVAEAAIASGKRRFKAETRRSDKSFPWNTYETCSNVGGHICELHPECSVDLHDPEFTINIEIRERIYVFGETIPGTRGLPVGSGGMGLLLLSGGIDSPVAGYLMAKRGLNLTAVYFHTYPYTSEEARQKVVELAKILAMYTGGLRLWTIPFTEVQMAIKAKAPQNATTLMMRGAMMELSHILAMKLRANCLVTGESLGQVASQTAENLRFTQSRTSLAVLRPLIGTDKEDTVALAKTIGSYSISILPYEDCCVLFSPKHPVLKAKFTEAISIYDDIGLKPLLDRALLEAELIEIPYPGAGAVDTEPEEPDSVAPTSDEVTGDEEE